jgi:hypothetical protein
MRKLLLAAAASAAVALGSTTANAAALVTNPGSLTPPASALFGNVFNAPSVPGNFNDTFAFTINGSNSVEANAQVGSILLGGVQNVTFQSNANCLTCGLWIDVMDAAHRFSQTSTDPAPEVWALLAPLILTPGNHTIIANGTLTGPSGAYSGTLNIQAVPVPEPATWAMMLVGFAGIGMILRRSRRPALAQIA